MLTIICNFLPIYIARVKSLFIFAFKPYKMSEFHYLLQCNGAVLFVSRNVKTLWSKLWDRCETDKLQYPDLYPTVLRRIDSAGMYQHAPTPGMVYQIVPVTNLKRLGRHPFTLVKLTDLKQTAEEASSAQG